jgi:glycosyltransferase involved in cell wall biosynthesis
MSGDYFCLVDSDDEIMPDYVFRMAGWLDDNKDYEIAACSYFEAYGTPENQKLSGTFSMRYNPDDPGWLEHFILNQTLTPAWIYMTRRPYADSIIKHFCNERRKTYEPLIVNPIASGGGKIKYFHEGLYKFNQYSNSFVNFTAYDQFEAFYEDYYFLHKWTIERIGFTKDYKKKLIAFARTGCLKKMLEYSGKLPAKESESAYRLVCEKILSFINESFEVSGSVTVEDLLEHKSHLPGLLEQRIREKGLNRRLSRIIAYGALGKRAVRYLPTLKGTALEPTTLWDINGDGINAEKPDFKSISEGDLLIFFPVSDDIYNQVRCELSGKRARLVRQNRINEILFDLALPQIIGLA